MTTLPTAAFITLSGAAAICAYSARRIMCSERLNAQARNLVDNRPDSLLNELVSVDDDLQVERLLQNEACTELVEFGARPQERRPIGNPKMVKQGCSEYDHQPIQVTEHRRVHKKTSYSQLVIAQLKNRFGHLKRDGANDKAVRRAALNIFKVHGVRPDHVERMIENVIVGVFIPSKFQLHAEELMISSEAMRRLAVMDRSRWFGGTLASQASC